MPTRFTFEEFLLIVAITATVSLIVQMAYRRLFPSRNAPSQIQARIDQIQRDLGNLERGHLSLRDDHQQLESAFRGRSRTAGPATAAEVARASIFASPDWGDMDARLQAMQKVVADLTGQPSQVNPKDDRPTQWDIVAKDDRESV